MNVNIEFVPGDVVWVMYNNLPKQVKIKSVTFRMGFDRNEKICEKLFYHVTDGCCGSDMEASEIFRTKEQLRDKVFG